MQPSAAAARSALRVRWSGLQRWRPGRQQLAAHPVHTAAASATPAAATPGALHPPVPMPLCLRPAVHEARLGELLSWRAEVTARITGIGDAFEAQDGGASMEELLREVTWVLEDTVAEVQEGLAGAAGSSGAAAAAWTSCQWRHLEAELRSAAQRGRDLGQWRLRLRASVQQLRELWVRRLEKREPFQYLIATAHWREFVLAVSPGILVPRPETEIFPDLAAQALKRRPGLACHPWADLGTGSGAIAIGTAALLKQHNKGAAVWAVDLSPVAVAHAAYNVGLCGLSQHVQVVQGSWCEPLAHLQGKLGGLLSNPPYIPRAQMSSLQHEVGVHEPWSALDGGEGPGLDSLQIICHDAVRMLVPGGFLALETAGHEQAETVKEMLLQLHCITSDTGLQQQEQQQALGQAAGQRAFEDVAVIQDCYGVPRFVVASRSNVATYVS